MNDCLINTLHYWTSTIIENSLPSWQHTHYAVKISGGGGVHPLRAAWVACSVACTRHGWCCSVHWLDHLLVREFFTSRVVILVRLSPAARLAARPNVVCCCCALRRQAAGGGRRSSARPNVVCCCCALRRQTADGRRRSSADRMSSAAVHYAGRW